MIEKKYLVKIIGRNEDGYEIQNTYIGKNNVVLGLYGPEAIRQNIDKKVITSDVLERGYKRVSDAKRNNIYKTGYNGTAVYKFEYSIIESIIEILPFADPKTLLVKTIEKR